MPIYLSVEKLPPKPTQTPLYSLHMSSVSVSDPTFPLESLALRTFGSEANALRELSIMRNVLRNGGVEVIVENH